MWLLDCPLSRGMTAAFVVSFVHGWGHLRGPERLAAVAFSGAIARGVALYARRGAATAVSLLPRAAGWRRRTMRRLLVEALADRAALLCPVGHTFHLRPRPRPSLDGGDRGAAGL